MSQPSSQKIRNTHFTDSFSQEIFEQTYRFGDETSIDDRHLHIAEDLAATELPQQQEYWKNQFLDILEGFQFLPGGRITANAGTGLTGATYINCFVSGFRGEDQDSMESILAELRRQALILKAEGGYGFCANVLRPRGAPIKGTGGTSPGAVKLLEMWDTQSDVITSGGGLSIEPASGKSKVRKGAQMVTLSDFHPDVIEFIQVKQEPGRLTRFNMSVLVSDPFMHAIENHKPWNLVFPDFEKAPLDYKKRWDGQLDSWQAKGLPVKTYHTFADANELWDMIMKATYNRNEPGVLFIDTINRLNNLSYCEYINATNPCGEQVLPVGGCCLLGSLNLTQFVIPERKEWDFPKLSRVIPIAVRFLDNVNDRTPTPLPEHQLSLKQKRRIGLGVLGYGSALMMMKVRYGSKQALELTETLARFIMNEAYKTSSQLAQEKGAFPLFDKNKYLQSEFLKNLDPPIRQMILKQGTRNSHLLSIQPTGNSSILANNVSSGLEPVFESEYVRTSLQPFFPKGLEPPALIDGKNGSHPPTPWHWIQEGDEKMLATRYQDAVWKWHPQRGLSREFKVQDYAVRYHTQRQSWDPSAQWAATTHELSIQDHIQTMAVFSKFVDSSLSKTVNVPEDYPFEQFKNIYSEAYHSKTIKGCTTYRAGTMSHVLASTEALPECGTRFCE